MLILSDLVSRLVRRTATLIPLLAALAVGGVASAAQPRPADAPPGISVTTQCEKGEAEIRIGAVEGLYGLPVVVSVDGGAPVNWTPSSGEPTLWFYHLASGYHDVSVSVDEGTVQSVNDLDIRCAQAPTITYSCRGGQAYVQVALDSTKPEWTYNVVLMALPDYDPEEYNQSGLTGTIELGPFPDGSGHSLDVRLYVSGNYFELSHTREFTFDCASYVVDVGAGATGSNTGPMLAVAGLLVGLGMVLTVPRRMRRA